MKHTENNATANALIVRVIGLGLMGTALTALPSAAQTQDSPSTQSTSAAPAAGTASSGSALGDYARQIRKGSAPAAKAKVFDNDNLPKEDKLSVVGTPSQAPVDTAAKTDETTAAPAAANVNSQAPAGDAKAVAPNTAAKTQEQDDAAKQAAWKQWGDKINAQKDSIDLAARELDVLQREYQIRAAAMYADVGNRMRNSADWDKQDADYKQKIADKQKAVEDAKQKLDDMQEEARKAGVPASMREPGQ